MVKTGCARRTEGMDEKKLEEVRQRMAEALNRKRTPEEQAEYDELYRKMEEAGIFLLMNDTEE